MPSSGELSVVEEVVEVVEGEVIQHNREACIRDGYNSGPYLTPRSAVKLARARWWFTSGKS